MKKPHNYLLIFVLFILWSGALAQAPYCTPTYTSGCQYGDGLTEFQLESISQEIQCTGIPHPWYHFYTDTTALTIGESYTLTVFTANDSTRLTVWIDFNNDNQFEPDEAVVTGLVCMAINTNIITNLNIPATAPVGLHRMRFRTTSLSAAGWGDACMSQVYGNSGDFMVNLLNPPAPSPVVMNSPANGATGILPSTSLEWTPGAGWPPTGYYLYLGTDNPPTNIQNGTVVSIPYFNPFPDLLLNTTYYWKVVPYNSGGMAVPAEVWSFTTLAAYGSLQGYVTNFTGVPVSAATVTALGSATWPTTTNAAGHYLLAGLPPDTYTLTAQAASYNTSSVSGITVNSGIGTSQDLVLLQPTMTVLPVPNNVTLNPNEVFTNAFSIINTGNGVLNWSDTIVYGNSNTTWFTMPAMNGTVPASSNASVPAVFNAEGIAAGTVLSATVTFISSPNVGTVAVPVNMIVSGTALAPVTNLQSVLTNSLTGAVALSWDCIPSAGFLYYNVKRNGVHLANVPSEVHYDDMLPDYGTYTYCVEAVYTDGVTAQSCAGIEWPNPDMVFTPTALIATVWSNSSKNVALTIGNTGVGTLAYEFPDYVDHAGDNLMAYCPASASGEDEFISRVQFGTINHSSGWTGYSDNTLISTDISKNIPCPVIVTIGPPSYSGDITGVWIDYNHNNTFDAVEFTPLTGTSSATGFITVPSTALSGPTTMRIRNQYNGVLSPCGTTPYGEVEDYTVILHDPTFITQVMPASGMIAAGGNHLVQVGFSATGSYAQPGVYYTTLKLSSNDLAQQMVNIPATMIVGLGAYVNGIVTDAITLEPLSGALVQIGQGNTLTDDAGYYSMQLDSGTYNVAISKIGYQPVTLNAIELTGGITVTLDAALFENPYPPACAYASVNATDTECTVTWCPPAGLYELLYDDGSPENYAAWLLPGNMNAVKFTPKGYPATVTGARLRIDNSFNGSCIGTTMLVEVYTAGADGLPAILLDSVAVTITNAGWVDVNGLNASLSGGDFFIVMVQNEPSPNCANLGVDETMPIAYKSYSRNVGIGGAWEVSPYQDFMIRAIINGPLAGDDDKGVSQRIAAEPTKSMIANSKLPAEAGSKEMSALPGATEGIANPNSVSQYQLSRIFLGVNNPVSPANGVFTLLNNSLTGTTYVDGGTTWNALAQGWYAYGIKATYPGNQLSAIVYTNAVPNSLSATLTVNVQLDCGPVPAAGAIVKLTGMNYPFAVITDTINDTGSVIISNMIKGEYAVKISYPGYYPYVNSVSLTSNLTLQTVLGLMRIPPRNLYVDNATLVTTWNEPLSIVVNENFESGVYPPLGWQATSQGTPGWYFTTDGSSSEFTVPFHTTYAVTNDDQAGSANNGCCDYLITPEVNLTGAPSYKLTFSSYFNGNIGQMAYVEMSTDDGATWTNLYTCLPGAANWNEVEIDLTAFSGPTGLQAVKFALHADDGGGQASGWAVDDIIIRSGGLPVEGFSVMLDGLEVGQTNDLVWYFDPATFNYAQSYSICVAAVYCGINSETVCDTMTSHYLCPPVNLKVDTLITSSTGAAFLSWNHPLDNCLPGVVAYHIYRNDVSLVDVPATDTTYLDAGLPPTGYCYDITAVYDITAYGFPGLFAESLKAGAVCVDIAYGMGLPFFEDFSSGTFDTAMWNAGVNWLIDDQSDNPVPAAKFRWDPLLLNYSSALESHWINPPALVNNMPYKIWFDYEVKLEDQAATSTEKLTVEIWDGTTWQTAKEYLNTGSFGWTAGHLDVAYLTLGHPFKLRFRASGSSSDGIHYWAVDNIHVYTETFLLPPVNLLASMANPGDNAIQLTWGAPLNSGTLMSYILDDNTAEGGVYYSTSGECWLGNEFPVSESGVLQSVSLFMEAKGSATYTIDIFDSTQNLAGSSAPFTPTFGDWTHVDLPYIAYHGTFYVMVHMIVSTTSDLLNVDEDGPYSASGLLWYYEGTVWSHLTDFGFNPSVALIRANGIAGGKKSAVTYYPGTGTGNPAAQSPASLQHIALSVNTGNKVAQATSVNTDSSDTLTGYNVYRRAYASYPPGQNSSGSGDWLKLNTTVLASSGYLDTGLSNLLTNCYEYVVKAAYVQGESAPSNIAWQAILVGINPSDDGDVNLYPNPATTFVRIELTDKVTQLNLYNALGALVATRNVNGETAIVINTAAFEAGMYNVRFTTLNGESFNRKLIVTK